ncbi:MAG: phosphotransferase [Tepidiformaceae bacterium]
MQDQEVAEALLEDLRALLRRPALAFLEPPTRLTGGYDTQIFAFQLKGAPPEFSGRLVLRAFAPADGHRARFEGAAQSAIADLGYPAPRALHVSEGAGPLGLPYLLMPRADGETLLSMGILRFAGHLARAHAALHALDPAPVRLALEVAGSGPIASGVGDWLAAIAQEVAQPGMEPLRPAAEWLHANRPRGSQGQALCHLDLHPLNVLAKAGGVTGVVDWSNLSFGDPAADVACTRVILTLAPYNAPFLLGPVAQRGRRFIAWRYLRAYRAFRPLAGDSLRYYEALRCFRAMSHLSRVRLAERGGAAVASAGYAWSDPETIARLTSHFRHITDVTLGVVK